MSKLYGYTVATMTDGTKYERKFRIKVQRFETLLATPHREGPEWGGLFIDGFKDINEQLWKRTAGAAMKKRLLSGDYLVIVGMEKVFLNFRNLVSVCREFKRLGIRVILQDLHIDLSTPAGKLFMEMLVKIARMPERRRIALRIPKIV